MLRSMSKAKQPLFILYGSATGNAEHIAKDLAAAYEAASSSSSAETRVFDGVVCCELDQFKKQCLGVWETPPPPGLRKYGVLVVTSTTGNGDAPENAGRFVRHVKRCRDRPFAHLAYAVLGLGDTNYDQFCATGKLLDRKLEELGGTRVRAIACADEATGLEDVVEPWTASILDTLTAACRGDDSTTAGAPTNAATSETDAVSLVQNGGVVKPPEQDENPPPEVLPISPPEMGSLGVQMVKALLHDDASLEVDPQCLPALLSSRSSCELIGDDEAETQRLRGLSVGDTVSSVSAGYHYTARNPYDSDVLGARYLTQTPLAAARRVAILHNDAVAREAPSIYDAEFPLLSNPDAAERNGKRVIELTLSLPDDLTLEYAPGDSLGLLVDNTPDAVAFVLDLVAQHHGTTASQLVSIDQGPPVTVRAAVEREIDLCSTVRNKRVLLALSHVATDPVEARCLRLVSSKSELGETLFASIVEGQRLNVVDLLRAFPSTQGIALADLLNIVPGIPPRYYSVSSSPLHHKNQLTVAFSVVDYLTPSLQVAGREAGQRRIRGVATRYMEALASGMLAGDSASRSGSRTLRIFPKPTADFRMPSMLTTPLILIGPGTGVAPFMGFLQHRRALRIDDHTTEAAAQTVVEGTWRGGFELEENELTISKLDQSGLNVGADYRSTHDNAIGSVDVFFGCRHAHHDWLYRDEMLALLEAGVVSKLYTAISRDSNGSGGSHKYVQDIMLADAACGDRLVDLICNRDAAVYVCGDGNAMAKDVQAAIVELLRTRRFRDEEDGADQAKAYLEEMKVKQRFLMDIWS